MRLFIALFAAIMPMPIRMFLYRRLSGFEIHATARIGRSLVLPNRLVMGPNSRIGSLTMVKGITELRMGESAILGNLNWVTGTAAGNTRHFLKDVNRHPALTIGEHAAITHRHLIDCTDAVTIGPFTTFAGWNSQILTHAIDLAENRQSSAPVTIGAYCFIGTRVVILKGSSIPDRSVVAAGAVVTTTLPEADSVYGGVPAKKIGEVSSEAAYFKRQEGRVS